MGDNEMQNYYNTRVESLGSLLLVIMMMIIIDFLLPRKDVCLVSLIAST